MRGTSKNININQRSRKIDTEEKLIKYIRTQLGEPLIVVDVTEDQILNCIDDSFNLFISWAYDAQSHQVFIINLQADIQDYILDDRIFEIYDMSITDTMTSYGNGGGVNGMWGGFPMSDMMPPMYVPYVNAEGQMSSLENTGGNVGPATGVAGGVVGPHTTAGGGATDGIGSMIASWANAQTMQNLFSNTVSFDFNAYTHILKIFDEIDGPVAIDAAMRYVPNPEYDSMYGHQWIKEYALNKVKKIWGQNVGKYSSPLVGGSEINYDRLISEAQEALDKLDEDLLEKYSEALGVFSA